MCLLVRGSKPLCVLVRGLRPVCLLVRGSRPLCVLVRGSRPLCLLVVYGVRGLCVAYLSRRVDAAARRAVRWQRRGRILRIGWWGYEWVSGPGVAG